MPYDHQLIDAKWQAHWEAQQSFVAKPDRNWPKFYLLDMFPYPSGTGLHVGHPKGYVATDVVARAKRMMGYNVLYAMGWDSFGLPSERQAVREGISPQAVTKRNINTFKQQLKMLGLSYDWQRELATSNASYYKWTQWIFLQLYKRGLAYEAEVAVNWCPAQGTVLANEEVKDGCYVETGDPVQKRMMRQWMFRITDYAESLLAGLDGLDWPENVKEMQRNWIGRSEGVEINFSLADGQPLQIAVFTTRPDTLFGCNALVLAPEHRLISQLITDECRVEVAAYKEATSKRSEKDRLAAAANVEKTGVATGAYAINPINGEKIPVWIADYVLARYGTGAIFSCPAHDERDYAFAKKFNLAIVPVVAGGDIATNAYIGDGKHINSGFLNGLDTATAKKRCINWLEEHLHGKRETTYRLSDWLFSRQRYWGEPIPIVHTKQGPQPVPEEDLPVILPDLDEYKPTEDGEPPLARDPSWVQTTTKDGQQAERETSTMPQWAGSCWYYLRFINPKLDTQPWDRQDEHYWMPVDLYVGGTEHATLHLLYARFWHHVLNDLGLVSTREPFQRLFNQGMVLSTSYRDANGKYYHHDQVVEVGKGQWQVAADNTPVEARKEKMSKSKYNTTNPAEMCRQYGADSLRLYELFMSALEDSGDWEDRGVAGCRRFLDRTFRLATNTDKLTSAPIQDVAVEKALHSAIKKVTEAVTTLKFNTTIAAMMTFVNVATKAERVQIDWLKDFLRILSPFAPHVAAELWQQLGCQEALEKASFPTFDEEKIRDDTITLAVQVNGKLRSTIEVPADTTEADIIDQAMALENIQTFFQGKPVRRQIYVPGRLINLVV